MSVERLPTSWSQTLGLVFWLVIWCVGVVIVSSFVEWMAALRHS